MHSLRPFLAPVLFAGLIGLGTPARAQSLFVLLHSLYDPGTNALVGAQHGYSVAVDDNIVVVGAPYDDMDGTDTGVVNVYDATTGLRLHTLNNPNPALADYYGYSVAISGTRVVVGAFLNNAVAIDSGTAYVFDVASATPAVPVLTLTNPSPAATDYFGYSVAISGARVVVGAIGDNTGADSAGSAYVYDLASAAPTVPVRTLTNPSPAPNDWFGNSVAICGTRVAVGTYLDNTGAVDAGSAYLYDLSSATPVVTLTNPSPAAGDYFGISVALSDTKVVVGAYFDNPGAPFAGSAYVYDLTSVTPTVPVLTLNHPVMAAYGYFGYAVAISGTRVAVGAFADNTGATAAGHAYVFDLASATPTMPVATLTNPSPAAFDNFGFSVAIDGTTIVAGTPFDDTNAEDRGAAYIFGLRPALSIVPGSPGLATLSWSPQTSSGFVLQCAEDLASGSWSNAPSGALNPVSISTTNAARFYRLLQP